MNKYMLDTNICIYTIKNKPERVREAFKNHQSQLSVSTVTAMELIYGAEYSVAPERNLRVVEGFLARLTVLDYDIHAAEHTGQLRADLRKLGTPIGPFDHLIAGHARSLGSIVVTNNHDEFERVPGLRVENWVTPAV